MAAKIIDGRQIAREIRERVARGAAALSARGRRPGLAAVLIGDDAAAESYAASQARTAGELGISYQLVRLPADTTRESALSAIEALNADGATHGIIVLQSAQGGTAAGTLHEQITTKKDVEGLSARNLGLLWTGRGGLTPCTAAAAFECVRSTGVRLAGASAVVVGRSAIVGRPVAAQLLAADATVTQCHSKTRDLAGVTQRADVLVVAAGKAGLIGAKHVRAGAVVIDVGIHRTAGPDGASQMVGDVRFDEVAAVAGWITPVPGGVGPVTVAMLMANVLTAAER